MCKLRSWSNKNGDGYENITPKVKSRCFKLYRAYSILFNSSNVVNFLWSWILKECIEVQEKKKKVVVLCSRPPQNVKIGIFTSQLCSDGKKKCTKRHDAHSKLLFSQSKPLLLFCRSCWHHRCHCLNSLLSNRLLNYSISLILLK